MLVVKVELWSGGDRSRKKLLGTGIIANDGTGNSRVGNYDAAYGPGGAPKAGQCHGARVVGFKRNGGKMRFWSLVMATLVAAFGEDEL